MEGNSRANGWIISCMDLENIRGKMADYIKVSIFRIKNMAMVFINGPMDASIWAIGSMGSSMVLLFSKIKVREKGADFGNRANESNGFQKNR